MINNFALCIPTYNAGGLWIDLLRSINEQTIQPVIKIIIDSSSKDNTVELALENGFDIIKISPLDFDHGKARQQLVSSCPNMDICIFLTQDAILASPDSIKNIIEVFNNINVGLAYGRQLPQRNATTLEAHARLFNYATVSQLRDIKDIPQYGFKTIFCSNSFAAYRVSALQKVGGFPIDSIMGEDTIVAAKMIEQNWKIAYVAEATVFHSHAYTMIEEFRRYFDTGVFHKQNAQLYNTFGKPTGEGLRFVKSELNYSIKRNLLSALMVFPKTASKLIGFRFGLIYKSLPKRIVKAFSMHKKFWNK